MLVCYSLHIFDITIFSVPVFCPIFVWGHCWTKNGHQTRKQKGSTYLHERMLFVCVCMCLLEIKEGCLIQIDS